jgi:predicted TIM-barrel fold metal-dependent hydrolase
MRKRAQERPTVVDTHAFAFSPIFMQENRLPEDIDGTLDTLVEDMDRAGVSRTLATFFVTKHDDTFSTVASGLARHRGRLAAQLYLAANHPNWAAANARAAVRDPAVAGARMAPSLFKLHPVDETLEKVWDACEEARLPVQFVVDASKFSLPSTFAVLARARPELPLVLSVTRGRHRAGLPALARYPRVFFQVSGLLDAEAKSGDAALLRWACRALPAYRLMFGSDRLGREKSYFAKVKALTALPAAVRDQVCAGTALDLYGRGLQGFPPR